MQSDSSDEKPETPSERKPYVPPRIEETGSFEHVVLSCVNDTVEACVISETRS
jgi:hypothetical protein